MDDSESGAWKPGGSTFGSCVLVVSSDPGVRRLVRELAAEDIEAFSAESVEALVSWTAPKVARPPDFLFLDLDACLGREDAAVFTVRRIFQRVPVVALAGDLDGDRAARLLGAGVPSLNKPVSAAALSGIVRRRGRAETDGTFVDSVSLRQGVGRLETLLEAYALERALSRQQRIILRLHLDGNSDKEIASSCACSEATVYEHWRRMARKVGGLHKSCVMTDFHKFLDRE